MADTARSRADTAKELFVYGPLGLAYYLRDTAPQFLKIFVTRGRVEVAQRQAEGGPLAQARTMGARAAELSAPAARRLLDEGLSRAATYMGEVVELLGALASDLAERVGAAAGGEAGSAPPPDAGAATVTHEPSAGPAAPAPARPVADTGRGIGPAGTASTEALAISDYDSLAATHVIDRLEGLTRVDLEAIRAHEVAHRGRRTILTKIDQLLRTR